MKEGEIVINIERFVEDMNQEAECPDVGDDKVCGKPMAADASANAGEVSPEKTGKEKRLSMSAKKPPRPPAPRGLSLDAADQKLIKEISELLMMKRARIERIKALKKTKAAKGMSASSSSSSTGNFLAMLFTILFCISIIFQGCHPWGNFPRNSSPKSAGATEGNRNLSTSSAHLAQVRTPNVKGLQMEKPYLNIVNFPTI